MQLMNIITVKPAVQHYLPLELRVMIMNYLPDFTSLYNLVVVLDPSLTLSVAQFFNERLPTLLSQSSYLEPLIRDHLIIQQAGKLSDPAT